MEIMEKDGFESGEIIEGALSELHLGIAVMDGQGKILSWNSEMARQSGIPPEKARSRIFWEAYPGFFGAQNALSSLPEETAAALASQAGAVELGRADLAAEGGKISVSRRMQTVKREGLTFLVASSAQEASDREAPMKRDSGARDSAFMLDDAKATFWEWDRASSTIKANSAWAKRFDMPEKVPGRYLLEDYLKRVHPEDHPRVKDFIDRLARSPDSATEIEYRLREGGGEYAWILERIMRQERGPDGVLQSCIGRSADVSVRKELEFSINEKSRLLRQVIDHSPYYVFVRDSKGRFVLLNRAMADFYGKDPEDLIGVELFSVHSDREEAQRLLAEDQHVLRTGETLLLPETVLTASDGRKRVMEISLMPFAVPGLYADAVLGFALDITDMKRAQSALSGEKERLSVTLRSIGEGVIATDISGRVVLMNLMAQNLSGWDEREAAGLEIGKVFRTRRGRDSTDPDDPVGEILKQRKIVAAADIFLERRSGEICEISERGAPIIGEDGAVAGAVIAFQDVTERRAMERELEKIQKIEALGILAGGIAHDFNNILMSVLGNISLAKMSMEESDENWAILTDSEKAVLHAKSLTAQLSMMAKGGSEIKKEPLLIEGLLRDACAINLRGTNVSCDFEIEAGLSRISADPAQLNQVIQNLVINARESMPQGGRIRLRARRETIGDGASLPIKAGRYVRLDVTDSGTGIPPELAQRVFDPYFTTKKRGSGLGLTVCFSVIKKHGGTILVDSKPGEGTTFSIYLPDTA
jgi:PAS domain S-box-containing protein